MTYSESLGHSKIDWIQVIENPPEDNTKEYNDYVNWAGVWSTCPVGNLSILIERSTYERSDKNKGEPMDDSLATSGLLFFLSIIARDWEEAKNTLIEINKRSEFLLKSIKDGTENIQNTESRPTD